jgi:hypothetical protein
VSQPILKQPQRPKISAHSLDLDVPKKEADEQCGRGEPGGLRERRCRLARPQQALAAGHGTDLRKEAARGPPRARPGQVERHRG